MALFFQETHPGAEMASQNDQNGMFTKNDQNDQKAAWLHKIAIPNIGGEAACRGMKPTSRSVIVIAANQALSLITVHRAVANNALLQGHMCK